MKKILVIVIVIGLASVLFVLYRTAWKHILYPPAPEMPQVVETPVEDILAELEDVMKAKAPPVLEALQPGLSSEEIAEIERNEGLHLPEDIKALYRWRNGSSDFYKDNATPAYDGPIPGHRFLPLNEALEIREIVNRQSKEASLYSRFMYTFVIPLGHMKSWIQLFDDGAGDGYFYDPERKESEGALFYNFTEQGDFVFFPSMRNLLAAAVECYREGAFVMAEDEAGPYWKQDYKLSRDIWGRFGARKSQGDDLARERNLSAAPWMNDI